MQDVRDLELEPKPIVEGPPRLPYSAFLYWAPGFVTAIAIGVAVLLAGVALDDIGGTAALGSGLAVGAVIGYGLPFRRWGWAIVIVASLGTVLSVAAMGPIGLLCAVFLAFLCIPSTMIGAALGSLVRRGVKRTGYSQARFLPALLLTALALHGVLLEAAFRPGRPVAEIATSEIIDAPPTAVWNTRVFGADERAAPSVLARAGLPAPTGNAGRLTAVGDEKVCTLGDAVLRLRVAAADAPRELRFVVLEQRGFEDRSTQLLGGSVRLEPVGTSRTRVTFTTRHQPLIGPEWLWRPFERLIGDELHRHALRELARAVGERASADLDDE